MWSKRDEIDYALDRRATLEGLRKGLASAFDAKNHAPTRDFRWPQSVRKNRGYRTGL